MRRAAAVSAGLCVLALLVALSVSSGPVLHATRPGGGAVITLPSASPRPTPGPVDGAVRDLPDLPFQAWAFASLVTVGLLGLGIVVGLVWWLLTRRPPTWVTPLEHPEPELVVPPGEDPASVSEGSVATALAQASVALDLDDPRQAVIACWVSLEQLLEQHPGRATDTTLGPSPDTALGSIAVRSPHEMHRNGPDQAAQAPQWSTGTRWATTPALTRTSGELVEEVLGQRLARPLAVRRLHREFVHARFSSEPVTEAHRRRAREALTDIELDLRARA